LFGGDVVPYNSTILTDNEHGGCRLSIREEIVHAVFVGNSMFTVGQNRKLRLGFFNSACSLILWLNSKSDNLCSLFLKLGMVFCQPNELVNARRSGVMVIKNQDDQPVVQQAIGQAHNVPVAVR
jgi:hypothetical protein